MNAWGLSWGGSWGNSWGKTRVEESARSGYWRLFYYRLQEAALKQPANETQSKAVVAKPQVVELRTVKNRIASKRKATIQLVETPLEECPVPRKKLFKAPAVVPSIPISDLSWVFSVLAEYCFTLPTKRSILKPLIKVIDRVEQDNTRLLLLLAA